MLATSNRSEFRKCARLKVTRLILGDCSQRTLQCLEQCRASQLQVQIRLELGAGGSQEEAQRIVSCSDS